MFRLLSADELKTFLVSDFDDSSFITSLSELHVSQYFLLQEHFHAVFCVSGETYKTFYNLNL